MHLCPVFMRIFELFIELHMTRIEQFLLPHNQQEISVFHQKRVIFIKVLVFFSFEIYCGAHQLHHSLSDGQLKILLNDILGTCYILADYQSVCHCLFHKYFHIFYISLDRNCPMTCRHLPSNIVSKSMFSQGANSL